MYQCVCIKRPDIAWHQNGSDVSRRRRVFPRPIRKLFWPWKLWVSSAGLSLINYFPSTVEPQPDFVSSLNISPSTKCHAFYQISSLHLNILPYRDRISCLQEMFRFLHLIVRLHSISIMVLAKALSWPKPLCPV
jgi:hypothetical protein